MEKMLLPIWDVVLDPRMQAAPARVVKTYWNAVAMLWHEARRSGKAALPRALLKDCGELLQRELMLEGEDGLFIPWVTEAWEKVVSVSNVRKEAAERSAELRRKSLEMLKSTEANAQANAPHLPRIPSVPLVPSVLPVPGSDSGDGEVQKGKGAELPPGFARFWAAYPRQSRRERPQALRAWKRHACESFADRIVAKVEELKAEDDHWRRGYVKYPARWLDAAGWEDEPSRPPEQKSSTQKYSDMLKAFAAGGKEAVEALEERGAVIDITPKGATQ